MANLIALGTKIPRLYWRVQLGLFRRVLAGRRWPRREHLDRMSKRQFEAFARATGFDARVQAATAEGGVHKPAAHPGVSDPEDPASARAIRRCCESARSTTTMNNAPHPVIRRPKSST